MICTSKTKAGKPCEAPAQKGSPFCFRHDPENAEAASEASVQGGISRSNRRPPPHDLQGLPDLTDAASACRILSSTVHWVLHGKIDPRAANSVALCIRAFSELRRDEELETKLKELEAVANGTAPAQSMNGHAAA